MHLCPAPYLPCPALLAAQEEHAALHREREALRSRTDALQVTLMQTQGQGSGLHQESSPTAIAHKVRMLPVVLGHKGWC